MNEFPENEGQQMGRLEEISIAIKNDDADCVRNFLIRNPDMSTLDLEMLFFVAVRGDSPDVVSVFFEQGIDSTAFRRNGRTLLEVACLGGVSRVAGVLLDNGANPNIPVGDDGFSLLHHVVSSDNAELTLMLLKAGADLDALGPSGQTVMSYAAPKAKAAVHEFHAMQANRRLHGMHQRLRRARPNALI